MFFACSLHVLRSNSALSRLWRDCLESARTFLVLRAGNQLPSIAHWLYFRQQAELSVFFVCALSSPPPVGMAEEVALALGQLRRRRGVTRSSITRLVNRLKELEATADQPATPGHAQQLLSKLNDLDSSFKELHMQIIDKLEDGDTLEQEQIALDKHDDDIAAMTARLHRLMEPTVDASIKGNGRERRSISLKISRIEKGLKVMEEQMADLVGHAEHFDLSIVQQCQEQLSDYKKDLAALYSDIIDLEPKDDDELFAHHSKIETALFDCSHKIKKLINSQLESTASVASGTGVKLPKIDVPTFDGSPTLEAILGTI